MTFTAQLLARGLLAVLLHFHPYSGDHEKPEARRARLTLVADAITTAAFKRYGGINPLVMAAALTTVAKAESNFALYVGEGRCLDGPRGARCDPDPRTGRPRARTYFQLWKVACRKAWAQPQGSRAELYAAADCAAQRLAGAYYRCNHRHPDGRWAGAFSGYRSNICQWRPAASRARSMRSVQLLLVRSMKSGSD